MLARVAGWVLLVAAMPLGAVHVGREAEKNRRKSHRINGHKQRDERLQELGKPLEHGRSMQPGGPKGNAPRAARARRRTGGRAT